MEQTNLENQIKNKLNQRSIQPTAPSWDRLDAMLSIAEKPKRNLGWMYIAASFLGFILIATLYFSQTKTMIDTSKNQIAGNKTQKIVLQNRKVEDKYRKIALQDRKVALENRKVASKTRLVNESISNKNKYLIALEEKSLDKQKKSEESEIINPKFISSEVLLASVQSDIDIQKPVRKSDLKIDPKNLLSEVEDELNVTFRETTLERLSRNFKTIRTAVANRNKE